MPWYTGLARVARKTGYPVVEYRNWKTNGYQAMSGCEAIIVHHDVSNPRGGNAPLLDYIYTNKLSHYQLGRDGTIYVTGAGLMGHAGKDSQVSPAHARNAYSIGIEAANNGTGEPWSDRQMDSYVKLCRALIDEFKLPVSRVYGHKEVARPRGRKIDPNFSMTTFRNAVKRGYWTKPSTSTATTSAPTPIKKDWFSMASLNDLKKAIRDELGPTGWNYKGKGETRDAYSYLRSTLRAAERLEEALNTLPADVWKHSLNNSAMSNGKGLTATAGSFLTNTRRFTQEYHRETSAALAAQQDIIDQLSAGEGVEIDYKRVEEAARKGAEQAIKDHEDDDTTTIAEPAPLPARDDE